MFNTPSNKVTIADLFGQKERAGDVGIEIEVEGEQLPIQIGGAWLVKAEGSLRNGLEYYTRQPLKIDDSLTSHITKLTDTFKDKKVDMSNRTSVHVHVNVQRLTPVQVWTAAICYWMLEGPLTRLCGEKNRVGNLFCLGIEHAEGILQMCIKDIKGDRPFHTFNLELAKYGGQNLSAVRRFGSIEYRSMRGTLDPVVIEKWCRTLHHIIQASKTFSNPAQVIDFYLSTEKDRLLDLLLPDYIREEVKSAKDYKGLIRENIYAIAEVAYFPRSWDEWSKSMDKAYEERKANKDKTIEEELMEIDAEFNFRPPVRPVNRRVVEIFAD